MEQGKLWGRFWFGLIVASLVLGQAPPAAAQDAGALFVPGPDLNIPRMHQYIATLTDGRVVVFGGLGNGHNELDSAEVWSPGSNSFTLLRMNYPRYNYAFTRMRDRRYLLAGGVPEMETVEFFDPWGSWFEPFGHLNIPRQGCSAATLYSGQVLVVGGWEEPEAAIYAEVMDLYYSPNFEVTRPLNFPRSFPVVLPARERMAVVAGGLDGFDPGRVVEETELYDYGSNSFEMLSPTLLPGEHGWQVRGADYLVSMEAQRLPDRRYLLLAKRPAGSGWEYKLVTFDPDGLEFARFETNPPLPSYPTTWLLSPVVDGARGKAYIPAYVNFNHNLPVYLRLYTVDLTTGALNSPTGSSRQSYFPSGPWTLLPDGRLLTCGGSVDESETEAVVNTLFATPGAGKKPKPIISPVLELLLLQ